MAEFAVSAADGFYNAVPKNSGKPFLLTYSNKSTTTDIADDAFKFSEQIVEQINLSKGTDSKSTTLNIDEFTRFASNDQFKTFAAVDDAAQRAVIQETFKEISGNRSEATIQDLADYLRVRDSRDGDTNGQAMVNFLI
ncbi:hypothetical protein HY522_07620 [bacterium]|nr:hypothetical protein [bacterium]